VICAFRPPAWVIASVAYMGRVIRGRILRDTAIRDGLVFVDGKQYLFQLENMWKSEFAPKINMLVDVEFDERGRVVALRAAPVEDAAADHADQAVRATRAATRKLAQEVQSDALPAVVQYAQAIGYPTLLAMAGLLLGWFYFSAASLNIGTAGRIGVTFYQVLRFLNFQGAVGVLAVPNSGASTGLYGFVCILCCLGMVLPWLWRDRRASYAMLAPLAFMVLVGLLVRSKVLAQLAGYQHAISQFGSFGGTQAREITHQLADRMATRMRNSISLDFGAWLSLAASLYLGWRGVKLAKSTVETDMEREPRDRGKNDTRGTPTQRTGGTKAGVNVGPASPHPPST
jgi:hypothetical protein